MRSLNRLQRGSTNWPFVIALLLLIVFIYLWYDCTDKRDTQMARADKAEKEIADLRKVNTAAGEELNAIAALIGFKKAYEGGIPDTVTVDRALLEQHLADNGSIAGDDGAVDGLVALLIKEAVLKMEKELRPEGATSGTEKSYKSKVMSEELKNALADLPEVPSAPPMPMDQGDADAMAEYKQKLADYEAAVAAYRQKMTELSQMEGFEEVATTIMLSPRGNPDGKNLVEIRMFGPLEELTVRDLIAKLPQIHRQLIKEFVAHKNADTATIVQLREDINQRNEEITRLQGELKTEQEAHQRDLANAETQLNEANERTNINLIAKTNAEQALALEKEGRRKDVGKLTQELEARKEALRILKQKRDLVIRRDDIDGKILAASNSLRTATINLGFKDKVYVGQQFNVSALNNVGDRVPKGEVMVTRVTGDHSARARITSATSMLGSGDLIHNPFYSPTESIHVWFAGTLDKWPREMAAQRLGQMNVTVQDAMNGKTDYVVVPDSWVLAEEAAPTGDEDEEEEDEDSGAASPLDQVRKAARLNGATIITESLLDAFLDF